MKKENQKLKTLYVKDILLRETDEDHSISTKKIIELLSELGIEAERKSVYSDIYALSDSGFIDIAQEEGRNGGFRAVSREFELAELKMLVDAIQSSKFITAKKSRDIIKKLESFAGADRKSVV